jgi:thiol:disulfide interchange protein DsbC
MYNEKMRKILILLIFLLAGLLFIRYAPDAQGFGAISNACAGDCNKCHSLSIKDAETLLKQLNPNVSVISVELSPVRGLWEVVFEANGKKGLTYIDISKEYVVAGSLINIISKSDITRDRLTELNKVDVSKIPVDEALLMGSKSAKLKVIVFDDPD